MKKRLAAPSALLTSVLLHGLGIGAGAWLLSTSLGHTDRVQHAAPLLIDLALDAPFYEPEPKEARAGAPSAQEDRPKPRPAPVVPGGGEHVPRPDRKRAGRGGSAEVRERALNLADSDDSLTLNRDPLNCLDQSQVQRLDTHRRRRSLDDRRATPHPMEWSFLASGSGALPERRDPARFNPSNGLLRAGTPSSIGGAQGAADLDVSERPAPASGVPVAGGERNLPGQGSPFAPPGDRYQRGAAVMLARPWVPEARAAVPAPDPGRPDDSLDSTQEVSSAVASLIHASTAGGRLAGTGPGGENGPGPTGNGGLTGPGSRSLPSGDGPGPVRSVGQAAGVVGYFRGIVRRVDPFWKDAFPDWAIAEGRGGVAIIGVTLQRDGSVLGLRVVRGSGVVEFDRNVLVALQRAAPYGPLPSALGRGPLTVNVSFDALNPAVGRDGPGKGRAARHE